MAGVDTSAAPRATTDEGLLPAREIDLRKALRLGVAAGIATSFVGANGMLVSFAGRRIVETLSFSTLLLAAIPFGLAAAAGRLPVQLEGFAPTRPGRRNVLAGLLTGLVGGVLAATFLILVGNINIRSVLVNVSPEMVERLSFGQDLALGAVVLILVNAIFGTAGGALHLLDPSIRRAVLRAVLWVVVFGMLESVASQLLRGSGLTGLRGLMYGPAGALTVVGAVGVAAIAGGISLVAGRRRTTVRESFARLPASDRRNVTTAILLIMVLVLAILPRILGQFLSEVMDVAMIFMLMALGLNIVVGFAGLLDLGYVAFFAVGAYTAAVFTSSSSPGFSPELTFWAALPFVMIAAAIAGLVVGTPVLRMRGDYLAIVTLAFGEIARLLAQSDWLKGTLGGAQGIVRIPNIVVGPWELRRPQDFFYAIVFFAIVAAYVSYSLQDSRIGRAWMAMREDEIVAEAMGVNIVAAKLWAFVIGATLASFGGALFASKIGSVFPHSFDIVTSITILVIVIVGGLGSVPGVVVAALALVALPELLREFEQYRFLIYGALLIFMMINRPEGLIPSRRRAQELREEEVLQDAWLSAEREQREVEEEGVPGTHGGGD